MRAQIEAGYIKDISEYKADFEKAIYAAPLNAYVVDGKLYGIPIQLSDVSIIYNKELLAKAGVDPASMATWEGFLDAVKKIKDAGITPLIMGGGDKWPMHFVWSYLLMRIGGDGVLTTAETTDKRLPRAALHRCRRQAQGACRPRAVPGRLARHQVPALAGHVR